MNNVSENSFLIDNKRASGDFIQSEGRSHGNLEKLHKTLIALYRKYTTLSKRELDKILLHDYMWTAKECKQKGFVDNIKTTHVDKLEFPSLDK